MPTETAQPAPLPPSSVPMFGQGGQLTREWFIWFLSVDKILRELRLEVSDAIDDIEDLTP